MDADVAVVGGGILGLATAHRILESRPSTRITVLERAAATGTGQSSRNSGVLHAGIYYAAGSAKAQWSSAGKAAMERFCDEHGIPVLRRGKLVVAVDESELPGLKGLAVRARANGVPIEELDAAACRHLEPAVGAIAGILSPGTSNTDFGLVCAALERIIRNAGATIRTDSEVISISRTDGRSIRIRSTAGDLEARSVVVCAGLHADRMAIRSGLRLDERIVPFRGSWLKVREGLRDIVHRNIYPVPQPGLPFLGVHLTPRIDGELWIGPNAVLAPAREGRGRWSPNRSDLRDMARHPGLWRLGAREWRTAAGEVTRDLSVHRMMRMVRRYVPSLEPADVERGPWGVRAQLLGRDGRLVDDFRIHRDGPVLHVLNAPSPAATASLSIGAHLRDEVLMVLDGATS